MIHIVFEEANKTILEQVIGMDPSLAGDIICIKDDYAVGPLEAIYETAGYQARKAWWEQVLEHSPYTQEVDLVNDKLAVHQLIKQMEEDADIEVWVWMGQNAHDVCGYYWLISQFKDFAGRIHVLYLNNLPFFNEKGNIFYPTHLHEIQPKEFIKAKKLARPISLSEFEVDPDEWKKICNENDLVRFLEGGKKIIGKEVEYYDKYILSQVHTEPQKLTKIVANTLNKMPVKTGDVFLVWRIKALAAINKLVIQGDWEKGWKDIQVQIQTVSN
jgi:hypothetical protein